MNTVQQWTNEPTVKKGNQKKAPKSGKLHNLIIFLINTIIFFVTLTMIKSWLSAVKKCLSVGYSGPATNNKTFTLKREARGKKECIHASLDVSLETLQESALLLNHFFYQEWTRYP